MLAHTTKISPHTHISRTRILPCAGKVLARLDQQIDTLDTVAETRREGSHVLVDVRRILNLKNTSSIDELIVRKPGDHVKKGDVLAAVRGVFQRVLRSPASGEVVYIEGGRIFIKVQSPPSRLLSGFSGFVTGIIPDRGAVIENNGAVIQAVWGNGQINQGSLVFLSKNPNEEMNFLPVDGTLKGGVVAAGHCGSGIALQLAGRLGLNGLILASMSPTLVSAARRLPFPVVLVEGFGNIAYNKSAFDILGSADNRKVCLFGANNTIGMGERPEVFIPLEESNPMKTSQNLDKNRPAVRVRVAPYAGRTGIMIHIYPEPVTMPNGITVPAADVLLATGEKMIIPLVNLEIIE